jgi:hypothetical protein
VDGVREHERRAGSAREALRGPANLGPGSAGSLRAWATPQYLPTLLLVAACSGGETWVGHIATSGTDINTKTFTGPNAKRLCEELIVSRRERAAVPFEPTWPHAYVVDPDGTVVLSSTETLQVKLAKNGFKRASPE